MQNGFSDNATSALPEVGAVTEDGTIGHGEAKIEALALEIAVAHALERRLTGYGRSFALGGRRHQIGWSFVLGGRPHQSGHVGVRAFAWSCHRGRFKWTREAGRMLDSKTVA